MRKYLNTTTLKSLVVCALIISTSCTQKNEKAENMNADNVLLQKWTGPYGGVPSFDKMNLTDLKSALDFGMKKNLEDINAITSNSEAPTFEIR